MPRFAITDAPSILGLKPTGVEGLYEALKAVGLQTGLNAEGASRTSITAGDGIREKRRLDNHPVFTLMRVGLPPSSTGDVGPLGR